MVYRLIVVISTLSVYLIQSTTAQRGFYAGARPQGYKDKYVPLAEGDISNRFGGGETINTVSGTLPVNAHGDVNLVNRLANLPQDQQPFWFLNYQLLEAQRRQPFPAQQSVPLASRSPFAGTLANNGVRQPSNIVPASNVNTSNRFGINFDSNVPVYQGPTIGPFPLIQGVPPTGNQLI